MKPIDVFTGLCFAFAANHAIVCEWKNASIMAGVATVGLGIQILQNKKPKSKAELNSDSDGRTKKDKTND